MDLLLEHPAAAEPTVIKALSLWQPWPSLIARGVKRHITMTWPTSYRGPLAIHAGKTLDLPGAPARLCASALGYDWWSTQPLGCIVAIAELVDCRPAHMVTHRLTRADLASGDFSPGRFAWELARVRALREPIPLAGRQALFNWSAAHDLDARLRPPADHQAICHTLGWA